MIEEALEELRVGNDVIAEWQKHIRIADQSPHHWRMVKGCKKVLLEGSEEEDKRWKAAEKLAKQDVLQEKQWASTMAKPKVPPAFPPPPPVAPQWPVSPINGPHHLL